MLCLPAKKPYYYTCTHKHSKHKYGYTHSLSLLLSELFSVLLLLPMMFEMDQILHVFGFDIRGGRNLGRCGRLLFSELTLSSSDLVSMFSVRVVLNSLLSTRPISGCDFPAFGTLSETSMLLQLVGRMHGKVFMFWSIGEDVSGRF